ncbi:serine/threonine-protein kinase [Haliangium sp.]|uniref:serine/threonine-protein kinase n=1 Tax=Haliangium sp. TaxID=2663208 RepID=UPI003D0F03A1
MNLGLPPQSASNPLANYEAPVRLAFGGMAELFVAWQRGANGFRRQVVLKRILPQFASDAGFVEMFLNEARIALTLSHPNIVRCYDLVEAPEGPTIVMEYVRGATVREMMAAARRSGERLPYGLVVRIMSAVADALDYAYNGRGPDLVPRRIIHRDVTPTNVLVSTDGDVKLTDFGIAKAMQSDVATRTASLKGKCAYMAPELVRGEPIDHRTDIFSAGVMLYELTTGRRAFRRDTDMATMQAILRHELERPSEIVSDYPRSLERLVLRAMAHDPAERYDSASELSKELHDCAISEGWPADRQELEHLMRRTFPDRLSTAHPAALDASVGSSATDAKKITASLQLPSAPSASPPATTARPVRHHHWEIVAVSALVVSALFWAYLML